jgi:hypothetical protein
MTFVKRILGASLFRGYLSKLSIPDRVDVILQLWRSTNVDFTEAQRFQMMQLLYDNRRMINYSMLDSANMARIYGFFRLIEDLAPVAGDIVECGVGRGISLAYLVYAVSFFKLNKTVYGFDSFAGFPEAHQNDLGQRVTHANARPPGWDAISTELIDMIFSKDRSRNTSLLAKHDVPIKLIPGFFDKTLAANLPAQIALLHADADMYESTVTILEHGLPRVVPGGVIIFDEYHDARWPGVRKAVDEVCAAKGLDVEFFANVQRYGIRMKSKLQG